MSKPDFEAMAYDRLAGKQVVMGGLPYTRQFGEMFAEALNAAYEAGKKDGRATGMEQAEEIAEKRGEAGLEPSCFGVAAAIRAEKEKGDGM